MKLTLLFDMDGVITDMTTHWVDVYNERYNDNLVSADFESYWDAPKDVTKPECAEKVFDLIKEPGFFATLKPYPGAVEGFQRFCEDKRFDPYIVTAFSGDPNAAYGKMTWIKEHLPFFESDNHTLLTKAKQLVWGDVFVDDSVKNLVKWIKHQSDVLGRDDYHAVAMAAGHNEGCEDKGVDIRVHNFEELWDYINSIVSV